jgi:hypothetical protein
VGAPGFGDEIRRRSLVNPRSACKTVDQIPGTVRRRGSIAAVVAVAEDPRPEQINNGVFRQARLGYSRLHVGIQWIPIFYA